MSRTFRASSNTVMKKLIQICLFAALAFWVPSSRLAQTSKGPIAIVGGRLIDGYGGRPLDNSVVLIEGNRITAVGREGQVSVPATAKVIRSEGMTVMPGIMDMHVHLMLIGHGNYDHWFRVYPSKWRDVTMPIAARELLMAGVTTARDLGARLDDIITVRDRINRGEIPGPRMFVSGPFLQKVAPPLEAEFRWAVNGPADAAAKTKKIIAAGADCIKLIDQDQMSIEEVKAIVDTAHAAGLPVVAHAHRTNEIVNGLIAGVDCFEHTGLATKPAYDDGIIKGIEERNASLYWTPTLEGLFLFSITEDHPERLDDPRLKEDLPPDIYRDVRDSLAHVSQLEYFVLTKRRIPTLEHKFNQLRKAGVTILVGTDSGIPMNFHFDSTWREMVTMVQLGMPAMDVIRAATFWPARFLKKQDSIGTIAPGRLADVIVVNGDPLLDMQSMSRVAHVIKDGVQYK
jgi:imidazolonepropionase-like amidohydrolase